MDPKIIFDDPNFLVIDKPPGVIVNRADTSRHVTTVQDWAEKQFKIPNFIGGDSSEFVRRGGIVHRLDKETSGLLIISKNENAFKALQEQFKNRKVEKIYIALCHGRIEQDGEIDSPVGRLPWNRTKFGVLPEGRSAQTFYKVLSYRKIKLDKSEEELTLVEAYPKTGRTHQIRVHMRYIGHPIFSDPLYAGRKNARRDRKLLPRHFLHASKISFTNPATGERLNLESPLPPDLSEFLARLI